MRNSSDRRQTPRPSLDDPDGVLPPVLTGGGDAAAASEPAASKEDASNKPVGWKDLPQKRQLAILTLSRLSEPLVQTSLQAYMYYQLKWFDPSLPASTIATQAGIMHASFMAAQFITALLWGRVADSPRAGRKTVLLIGLVGTSLSCLGFGFSTTFWQALLFRTLGGATNGNIGVMRTMISEIVREKKFQPRAFMLLPMTFNVGVIIGPILGGLLSDPAGSYPALFGRVRLLRDYPYALPNVVSAAFLAAAAAAVWLGIHETLDALRDDPPDLGLRLGARLVALTRRCCGSRKGGDADERGEYAALATHDVELAGAGASDTEAGRSSTASSVRGGAKAPHRRRRGARYTQRLPFHQIFTRNVALTFFAQFFLTFHIGTFNALWFVFLSTPVYDPSSSPPPPPRHLPFRFTGGLGMPPQRVGAAMAILGVIGILMQLFLYPNLSARLGTVRSWRLSLLCFPLAYFVVPYLSVVPSTAEAPAAKAGLAVWLAICGVLLLQVVGRTFALPSMAILINNGSPHPSVLGTVHGLGQSVSSAARTIGPVIGGPVYGFGLNRGYVGLVWWALSGVSVGACLASLLVKEGDGHEIWLDGDEEDD
ncbi:Major facilitator superfamily transporter [Cordyceps fumosorosea ARSEF 2679]|uniref:Major facilitator superfamily transporter n=1 Tax=Cordyceps fumosorosea (strain ARSEF 2679) TaxID=1081104 RepID=A0A162JNC0_CORFA|nr:Major facilitator superfamily transporter [Cordyceps fumosorosea ARSEF 2679]OAA71412.1 Major facilitator superfamily transporter [Cordyceps fumosorosea ARSEF 2679]